MALNTTSTLSAADAQADFKKLQENHEREAFRDWPNEAGFDGLTEHRGPIDLKVHGKIPAWAAGSLYRTGPGACKVEDTKVGTFHISHWFDGLAHTHRFDIIPEDDGDAAADGSATGGAKVRYSSRRQAEKFVEDIRATGLMRALSFGQRSDPCVGMFSKFMTMFQRPDRNENICVTVNANLAGLPSSTKQEKAAAQGHRAGPKNLFLATDTAWLSEIDPQTMETLAYVDHARLLPELKGVVGPAHVQVDPETGDHFSFNVDYQRSATFRVFHVSAASGQTEILGTFTSTAGYIHSFFLTPSYVVVCVPVAHYKMAGIRVITEGSSLAAWKKFDPSEPCRWYFVDRHHRKGVVGRFESPAGFFFHSINAFEDESGDVLCDVVWFRSNAVVSSMYYDVLLNRNDAGKKFWVDEQRREQCYPTVVRYRFRHGDMGSKAATLPSPTLELQIQAPHAGEMPTINPSYSCKQHRYVYCLNNLGLSTLFDGIVKIDMQIQDVLMWTGPPGHTPGEAIFVARPTSTDEVQAEDDGVLLTVVLDGHSRKSYLLCLDAKTMTELGRAECDFAVGFGFHGQHVQTD